MMSSSNSIRTQQHHQQQHAASAHSISSIITPSCLTPPSLTTLAARAVSRCLIYEDYDDCCHYRWDPVNIWQYEIPQKKKKGKKATERSQIYSVNEAAAHTPKPAWQDIRKFRDWWWDMSSLGSMESVIRSRILTAFEQLSWTAHTQEEAILFLLLRICIETKIKLEDVPVQIESWCSDLGQIVSRLGPFPLLKLRVSQFSLELKPLLISLVQQLPYLQVLHVHHWALSNDFMASLGTHCRLLTEFWILSMNPQVFMSDESLFTCFFDGTASHEVIRRMVEGAEPPPRSFPRLRLLDLLYWSQTERFIKAISHFYPKVKLRDLQFSLYDDFEVTDDSFDFRIRELEESVPVKCQLSTVPAVPNRCATFNVFNAPWERLTQHARHSRHLSALRVLINKPDANGSIEGLGANLRKVVEAMSDLESMTVKHSAPCSLVDIVAPSLSARGQCLSSLYLYVEGEGANVNELYKVINACPRLCVLVLSCDGGGDCGGGGGGGEDLKDNVLTAGSRVELVPCGSLHTLGIITSHFPLTQLTRLLDFAHNLKCLGISYHPETFPAAHTHTLPQCDTLRSLHLQFTSHPTTTTNTNTDLLDTLRPLLIKFPGLKNISLDQKGDSIPLSAINSLLQTGLEVTQWPPEFLSLY